jgi:MerR family transcriptional regulator, copper efflux regulator
MGEQRKLQVNLKVKGHPVKIGELAAQLGIKPSAIRFYEASGLLPESRRMLNGYRDYGPEAVKRLQLILLAQRLGFSLESLRPVLRAGQTELPQAQVLAGIQARRDEIAKLRADLAAQDRELQRLEADCHAQWARSECVDLSGVFGKGRRKPSANSRPAAEPARPDAPSRRRSASS